MKLEKIMNGIPKEIVTSLNKMKKATTTDERLKHSKIINNLCNSLEVIFDLMDEMATYDNYDDDDYEDGEEDESIPF